MDAHWFYDDWPFLKPRLIEHWPLLNESDLDLARDAADMLVGRLQEHYGMTHEEAERELNLFLESQLAHM
jgi:hypothetical protein